MMRFLDEILGLLRLRVVQLATLAGLLIGAGVYSFVLKYSVLDLDVWWHLKVGDWILQHHAVPQTGILSRIGANLPWRAYSWGYEVLLSLSYRAHGLVGVGIFGTALTVLLAVFIFWMLFRLAGSFWFACLLSIVASYPVLFSIMPRPVFFTMMLFCVTLTLLLEANRSGRIQPLYWLPAIFLLWANLHIQFAYGLLLVGIFVFSNLVQHVCMKLKTPPDFVIPPSLPAGRLMAILAACVAATCIGPYWYHLYQVIFAYSHAKFAYAKIQEMQAINFRYSEHYVQLLLTAAGFFVVGRQKKLDVFKILLLTACAVISYRTARDTWFICLPAAAFIADLYGHREKSEETREPKVRPLEWAGVAVVVCFGLMLFANTAQFSQRDLDGTMGRTFPVKAVNYLRQHPVPGPLYNNLNWGGFLTWYMPYTPVVIDGRNDLYGDELDELFDKTELGDPAYVNDPYLNESGVVLLYKELPLTERLRRDPRFNLVYEDNIAVVFAHSPESTANSGLATNSGLQ